MTRYRPATVYENTPIHSHHPPPIRLRAPIVTNPQFTSTAPFLNPPPTNRPVNVTGT